VEKFPKRSNVLLVAYACRPGESSEREVGWKWANLIQEHHNVTVLTRESHREYIEKYFAVNGGAEKAPQFMYYDLPGWVRRFKKGERGLYLYYTLWSLVVSLKARRINIRDHYWDITHFLTFGTLIWPQFSFLMNTPYLLGPVGGGERIPFKLRKAFSPGGQAKIIIRRLVQLGLAANPVYWANLFRADRILVRTHETLEMIPKCFRQKTDLMLETALPNTVSLANPSRIKQGSIEIVSVGRLITSKFNPLMLDVLFAFKQAWCQPFRVTIIGDGPKRTQLEAQRDALGLNEVVFVGKKTGPEVFAALRASDIYFSTTMKEGGTWAFFEAIVSRLPIVSLKVNGPDMIVGDGCGIKIRPGSYTQVREDLVAGLLALANDPKLREYYAVKAYEYVRKHYNWERILEEIDRLYEELLAKHHMNK
jgi:glycosyltransferase involved in cell wall biosynthesis